MRDATNFEQIPLDRVKQLLKKKTSNRKKGARSTGEMNDQYVPDTEMEAATPWKSAPARIGRKRSREEMP